MGHLPPGWQIVRAFNNYKDAQVHSEQATVARCETTNEISRKLVSVIGALEKAEVSRALKISQLSDEVSFLKDIVTNLRGKDEKREEKTQ